MKRSNSFSFWNYDVQMRKIPETGFGTTDCMIFLLIEWLQDIQKGHIQASYRLFIDSDCKPFPKSSSSWISGWLVCFGCKSSRPHPLPPSFIAPRVPLLKIFPDLKLYSNLVFLNSLKKKNFSFFFKILKALVYTGRPFRVWKPQSLVFDSLHNIFASIFLFYLFGKNAKNDVLGGACFNIEF